VYTKLALSLEEKRAKYPEFVAASPRGLVPALRHRSATICDSTVILEYLEDIDAATRPLWSPDPVVKAHQRFWCIFINEKIIPFYYRMLMAPVQTDRDAAKISLSEGLKEWARQMAPAEQGPYFMGAEFSYVDVVIAPWWQRIQSVSKAYRDYEIPRTGCDEFIRLHIWYDAVRERPSYAATVVDVNELVKNYSGYADNSATSDAAGKFRGK
jgi:glutathione S-transferase